MNKIKGNWTYNKKTQTIDFTEDRYYINLDNCKSSAQVLDWIIQISKKRWITAQDLADLVWLLDDVLDIQAHLCSCGVEHGEVSKAEITNYLKKHGRAIREFGEEATPTLTIPEFGKITFQGKNPAGHFVFIPQNKKN